MRLRVENLTVKAQISREEQTLLNGLTFCVRSGEPLAIIGESGSGKTMLALALMGLLPENCYSEGAAKLYDGMGEDDAYAVADNADTAAFKSVELIGMKEREKNALRGGAMVYIPQSGAEYLNPALKIKTQLYESLKKNGIKKKSEIKSAALGVLESAGLDDGDIALEKYPYQLSGGQAQRVALSLSLCAAPRLVIADEPTRGIDCDTAKAVKRHLFGSFLKACVIVITHDLELAAACKRVLVLKDGEVMECGDSKTVLSAPQSEYTKELIDSMPSEDKDYA